MTQKNRVFLDGNLRVDPRSLKQNSFKRTILRGKAYLPIIIFPGARHQTSEGVIINQSALALIHSNLHISIN